MEPTKPQRVVIDRPILLTIDRLGDFDVPASGQKGTIPIDTAKNVHAVYLYFAISGTAATEAEIKAQVNNVRVKVGGVLIWDLTATQILDLYAYYNDRFGALTVAGVLPLVFTPYMMPLSDTMMQYSLGMLSDSDLNKRNTFSIEVTMQGTVTIDSCEVHLETDDFPPSAIGYHARWLTHSDTWAAASKQTIDNLPIESNCMAIYGYHVEDAQTISRVSLKVNDRMVINDQPNSLLLQKIHKAGRTAQSGYTHLDLSLQNDPRSFLDVSRLVNQYLDLTWAVAPTAFNVLMHKLHLNLN